MEEVLDLGFGKCSLRVQVPEKGEIHDPKDLISKNIVTSFVGLTKQYFDRLEREQAAKDGEEAETKDTTAKAKPQPTKIKYVGGSVEAACALGVADGIVDLVGQCHSGLLWRSERLLGHRIRGNNESRRPQRHRHGHI